MVWFYASVGVTILSWADHNYQNVYHHYHDIDHHWHQSTSQAWPISAVLFTPCPLYERGPNHNYNHNIIITVTIIITIINIRKTKSSSAAQSLSSQSLPSPTSSTTASTTSPTSSTTAFPSQVQDDYHACSNHYQVAAFIILMTARIVRQTHKGQNVDVWLNNKIKMIRLTQETFVIIGW